MIGHNENEAGLLYMFFPDTSLADWDVWNDDTFNCPAAERVRRALVGGHPTWRYRYYGDFPNMALSTRPPSGSYHGIEVRAPAWDIGCCVLTLPTATGLLQHGADGRRAQHARGEGHRGLQPPRLDGVRQGHDGRPALVRRRLAHLRPAGGHARAAGVREPDGPESSQGEPVRRSLLDVVVRTRQMSEPNIRYANLRPRLGLRLVPFFLSASSLIPNRAYSWRSSRGMLGGMLEAPSIPRKVWARPASEGRR